MAEGELSGYDGRRVGRFAWRHRGYALLLPVLCLVGTALHELTHAAVVVAQGGHVLEMKLYPYFEGGELTFGAVWYDIGGAGDAWIDWTVACAPYVVSLAFISAVVSLGRRLRPTFPSRAVLLALFHLPLVELSMGLGGLFRGSEDADLYQALAGHELAVAFASIAFFAFAIEAGRRLFERAWPGELSGLEYRVLLVAAVALPWLRP